MFEGKMTIGSALSHENAVIHAAFFSAARIYNSHNAIIKVSSTKFE
ncbi:MAG: hypothetical protein WCE81_07385 [Halobacteriota archaeon]